MNCALISFFNSILPIEGLHVVLSRNSNVQEMETKWNKWYLEVIFTFIFNDTWKSI